MARVLRDGGHVVSRDGDHVIRLDGARIAGRGVTSSGGDIGEASGGEIGATAGAAIGVAAGRGIWRVGVGGACAIVTSGRATYEGPGLPLASVVRRTSSAMWAADSSASEVGAMAPGTSRAGSTGESLGWV